MQDTIIKNANNEFQYISSDNLQLKRATIGSSGFDLQSPCEYIIKPLTRVIINTNIKVKIPYGYEGQIRSRSGLAANEGIFVLNSPGTIDSDYTGEIKVILFNTNTNSDYIVHKYDRIGQIIFTPIWVGNIKRVDNFIIEYNNQRLDNGLGSTGK